MYHSSCICVAEQDVYRRIQIAAAVHLIKNTPKGKSAEAHAIDVQQKLKLGWLNSVSKSLCLEHIYCVCHSLCTLRQAQLLGDHRSSIRIDEHILNQQQDALKLRLHSVVPQNNLELFEGIKFSLFLLSFKNNLCLGDFFQFSRCSCNSQRNCFK